MATTIQKIETPKRPRALDSSGNNNHGQIYSGRALEFDGIVDQLNTSLVFKSTTHTFAAWIKVNDTATNKFIIDTRDGTSDGIVFYVDNAEKIRFTLNGNETISNISVVDRWVRAVVTYNGSTANIYINGVLDKTASVSTTFNTTATLTIGDRSYFGSNYFDGLMSDVQVWNANWSADDVAYDYLNPESIVLNRVGTSLTNHNLKLWYPMQDGNRGGQSYVLDASNTGLGDEMITNGDFSDGTTGWTKATTASATQELVDGKLRMYSGSLSDNSNRMSKVNATGRSGVMYKLTIDASDFDGCTLGKIRLEANYPDSDPIQFVAGSNTIYFKAWIDFTFIQFFAESHSDTYTIDNVSLKPVNDKNPATTVFIGDELIASDAADNRTFDNDTGNWAVYDGAGNATAIANVGNKLQVTTTVDNADEGATLAIAHIGNGSTTSIVAGRSYRVSMDLDLTTPSSGTFAMNMTLAGDTVGAFNITTTETTYTKDFVAQNNTGGLFIYNTSSTKTVFTVDNVSVKEIGIASGWTDADQQLHIPQTALQSYNELLYWFGSENDHSTEVVIPDDNSLDVGTNDFSISIWFRWDGDTRGTYRNLISKGGWGNAGYSIALDPDNQIAMNTTKDSDNNLWAASPSAVVAGKWYHVVAVWDRSDKMIMYVNRQLQTLGDLTSPGQDISGLDGDSLDNSHNIILGRRGSTSGPVRGCATEIALFKNHTLNQEEVNELYNDGKALDVTTHSKYDTVTGYWRNNGLSIWKDLSTNSNDSNAPTGSQILFIPQGVDSSRDSQGFIMNAQKNTSSLNLASNEGGAVNVEGPGMEVYSALEYTTDGQFDGDSDGTGDFTIEFWFKTDRPENSHSVLYQNTARDNGNFKGFISWINSDGSVEVVLYNGTGDGSGAGETVVWGDSDSNGSVNYHDGNWHHFVYVADRDDKGTLIIDKVVKNIVDISANSSVACFVGSNKIGSSTSEMQGIGGHYLDALKGQVDGLKIYKDLLTFDTDGSVAEGETVTSGEVLINYNATKK